MSENEEKKHTWKDTLTKNYKLVVFRSEDFREVRSFNLTIGNIYILISTVLLLLSIAIVSLMAFTPIKKLIPGYGDIKANEEFVKLLDGIDEIDRVISSQETYLSGFQTMLTAADFSDDDGAVATIPNITARTSIPITTSNNSIPNESTIEPDNNHTTDNLYKTIEGKQIIPPVDGVISSSFQPEIKHYGLDVLAPKNSPIRSIMDGFIFSSGWDLETGYTIGIQHEGNILSFYKHNSILLKEKGTFVRAGEAVAIIGNTGTLSSGPHLHFELWHSGKPVNPLDFIKFN